MAVMAYLAARALALLRSVKLTIKPSLQLSDFYFSLMNDQIGLGLFCKKTISKFTDVLIYYGELITSYEVKRKQFSVYNKKVYYKI